MTGKSLSTQELIQLGLMGHDLPKALAAEFERSLDANPDALRTRVLLLGFCSTRYHTSLGIRERRRRHLWWVVNHLVDHPFTASPFCEVLKSIEPEFYPIIREFWLSKVEAFPKTVQVLVNAAAGLLQSDVIEAKRIAIQAKALEPANAEVMRLLDRIEKAERLTVPSQMPNS